MIIFVVFLWWTLNQLIVTEKLQDINPMGLSAPLASSYTKNCSETPNCHKNLEMIALIKIARV